MFSNAEDMVSSPYLKKVRPFVGEEFEDNLGDWQEIEVVVRHVAQVAPHDFFCQI